MRVGIKKSIYFALLSSQRDGRHVAYVPKQVTLEGGIPIESGDSKYLTRRLGSEAVPNLMKHRYPRFLTMVVLVGKGRIW